MVKKSLINQYLSANKDLIILNGKIPKKNWNIINYTREQLYNHQDNIAWRIGNNDLVIDVDPRNGGDESFKKLTKEFNLKLTPTVNTPRGGQHYYLSIPDKYNNKSFKKTLKEYPGIDFLTEGSSCTITGCKTDKGKYTWCDDLFGEFEQSNAPQDILDLITYHKSSNDLGDFEGLINSDNSNCSEEKVLEMLDKLDPSMGNDEWVKVGMALHEWDVNRGLELWEEWSKDGDNYQVGQTKKRWKSFDTGGGVSLGTISYMVKEVDYDNISNEINKYIEEIKHASEKDLEFNIVPKLKKIEFSKINREKLVKAIQDRYKAITGVYISINNIRDSLSNIELVNGEFIKDGETPNWCKNWVYVNSHTAFANLNTLEILKTEAFNIENGKNVPKSSGDSKQSASKYISDNGYINRVNSIAYLPNIDDQLVEIGDSKLLNCFNCKTVPKAAKSYSDEGKEAIRLIKKHIKFICTTEENSKIFTQWLAHQIQYPGKQVLWSPVIQSIQGVGKSFFGELLRCCLGDRNVGTVSPSQVISDFNGWATNVSVNVLEELRVKGRNRYDAINCLKPLITDRMIQINDKGIKQYMTYNTTNYICFTNYKDSLPIGEDDRRWWVIFTQISSLEEMKDYVNEDVITYFPKLFNAVRMYSNEVRKWLLEYKISDEFLNIKQAPMTDSKMSMIATEEACFEGLTEIKELIENGSKYYNKEVVSSSDLFEDLWDKYPDLEINNSKKHILLKKLGYSIVEKPLKINGKTRRIWKKKNYSIGKIRELFL